MLWEHSGESAHRHDLGKYRCRNQWTVPFQGKPVWDITDMTSGALAAFADRGSEGASGDSPRRVYTEGIVIIFDLIRTGPAYQLECGRIQTE